MYGSARSSKSPPQSPAQVTAAIGPEDDPRAAIAGLLRATPKRSRVVANDVGEDKAIYSTSPVAAASTAAAANVIAHGTATHDDAVWRSAKAAVDAVAVATDARRDTSARDAAHVVARAASARAEHAAEVASAAGVHAAGAAAFARLRPGAGADEEASAAARLADDAADVAMRAAAAATTAAARAASTSVRVAVAQRVEYFEGRARDLSYNSTIPPVGLPPTPTRVTSKIPRHDFNSDPSVNSIGRLPATPTLDLMDRARREERCEKSETSPKNKSKTPPSLGKPQRVLISEHDAFLFDAAEAKVRLREGRKKAAKAFAAVGVVETKPKPMGKQSQPKSVHSSDAVQRALAFSGAAGSRRNWVGQTETKNGRAGRIVVSQRAQDAMVRAAVRAQAKRQVEGGVDEQSDDEGGDAKYSEKFSDASFSKRAAKKSVSKPVKRYDPNSFDVSFTNAHSRFCGEMNKTDKGLFQLEVANRRQRQREALGETEKRETEKTQIRVSKNFVGPRPTKKSLAAAEAAEQRKQIATRERLGRLKQASAPLNSFPKFKASPAPSPQKPVRPPLMGSLSKMGSPSSARSSPAKTKQARPSVERSSPSPSRSKVNDASHKNVASPDQSNSSPARSLAQARALLADLKTGEPLVDGVGMSPWHELAEAGRRGIARVRAYQSAMDSNSNVVSPEDRIKGQRVPEHERYQHYKTHGFGGMGAKTSWAR